MTDAPAFSLADVCARHGITEADLALVVGVGLKTLYYWKRGDRRPSTEHCQKAKDMLGIQKWELRPDIWEPPTPSKRLVGAVGR